VIAFDTGAVACSGTLVQICLTDLRGIGPLRLYVQNSGSNALTAAVVSGGPASGALASLDSTTFASLAGSNVLQLAIAAPVDWLKFAATCAGGTTLRVWVTSGVAA
jgi:hypothetical protein